MDMEVQEKGNNMNAIIELMSLTGWTEDDWMKIWRVIEGPVYAVGFVGCIFMTGAAIAMFG